MSDNPRPPDDSGWVVEPGGMEIQVAVGPEAELTPEVRAALDRLLVVLEEQQNPEVEAFRTRCPAKCAKPAYGVCNPQAGDCAPKMWFPCANKQVCSVIME